MLEAAADAYESGDYDEGLINDAGVMEATVRTIAPEEAGRAAVNVEMEAIVERVLEIDGAATRGPWVWRLHGCLIGEHGCRPIVLDAHESEIRVGAAQGPCRRSIAPPVAARAGGDDLDVLIHPRPRRGMTKGREMDNMTRDDVMRETAAHIRRVGNLMQPMIADLTSRAINHDKTKMDPEEFDGFAEWTPKLRGMTYGSQEYSEALASLRPSLEHHYANNRHHPEYHMGGIADMDLLDMIEMLCDWKAATERHADGDLAASIEKNAERFGYGEEIKRLLTKTARNAGWI